MWKQKQTKEKPDLISIRYNKIVNSCRIGIMCVLYTQAISGKW